MENLSAKNLRIGNWVQDEHGIEQYVYRLWIGGAELAEDENGGDDLDYNEEEIFGIPINEEWLIKLGFTSNPYEDRYEIEDFYIHCDKTKGFLDLWITNCRLDLKYVHQLQNVFFALTGNELELKTDV